MKPNAIYRFRQSETAKTTYIFESVKGEEIPDLLPVNNAKGKPNFGKRYITYRDTQNNNKARFPYSFSVGNEKIIDKDGKAKNKVINLTGVNPTETEPNKLYGDDKGLKRNNALLFEFTNDMQNLAMYIFFEQASNAMTLWEKWLAGGLCMEVDPLALEQEKSPIAGGNLQEG